MCKYKFKTKFVTVPDESCYFQSILDQLKIPTSEDSDGYCILHSADNELIPLKELIISEYINYCNNEDSIFLIDLRGLEINSFEIDGKTLHKTINLSDSVIAEEFVINNCTFESEFFADNLVVKGDTNITNARFYNVFTSCDRSRFMGNFNVIASHFYKICDMNSALFAQQFTIKNVCFDSYTIFDYCNFSNSACINIFSGTTNGKVTFEKSVFMGQLIFENLEVNDLLSFRKTCINNEFYMQDISISGNVEFIGRSRKNKIFKQEVVLNIDESSFSESGFIYFETANLTLLNSEIKENLVQLLQTRRIKLGKDTEVYKFYFSDKFLYSKLNEIFLFDLITNIKNILESRENIKIEFSFRKSKNDLIVNYSSDVIRDLEEFYKLQHKALESTLLKIGKNSTLLYLKTQLMHFLEFSLENKNAFKEIDQILCRFLTPKSINLIINSPLNVKLDTHVPSTIKLINPSTFIIEQLTNEPKFNASESQFNEIKDFLINQRLDLQLIKDKLSNLDKKLDNSGIVTFLAECGISITNNISASLLFTILQSLILK